MNTFSDSQIKRWLVVFAVTLLMFLFFLTQSVPAESGSLGFTYSQIIDDRSLGVTADYETELTKRVMFEADGQIQAGDIYNAKINTDFHRSTFRPLTSNS